MPLKTCYNKPIPENIEKVVNYLYSIAGRKLKISCIRQNIFKPKWHEKEEKLKKRCDIQGAALFLDYLIKEESSKNRSETIKTCIADLLPTIRFFDSYTDTSFVIVSPNLHSSTIDFKIASFLFFQNQMPETNTKRYDIDLLVLHALRIAIERRVLNFLGIDFLETKGRHVSLSRVLPVAKKLKSIEYNPDINWNEISKVLKWLNHYMHRGLRPPPWAIFQAFIVAEPLFNFFERIKDNNRSWSIYASTFVENEDVLHNEINIELKKAIPDVVFKWLSMREIMKGQR